jgi:hypothetical protein
MEHNMSAWRIIQCKPSARNTQDSPGVDGSIRSETERTWHLAVAGAAEDDNDGDDDKSFRKLWHMHFMS